VSRRADIDRAKGLAIVLVVFGHIVARQEPSHVVWYPALRRAIYGFHMPFFFYLSGLVAWLAGHATAPPARWPALFGARVRRLLIPFGVMAFVITAGKLAAARFIHVDNMPGGLVAGLADVLWRPLASPAYSLWYLATLFLLSVATPPLFAACGRRLWPVIGVFAAVQLAPLPWHLYLAEAGRYAIFFGAGLAAGALGDRWTGWIDRWRWSLLAVFAAGCTAIAADGGALPFNLRLLGLGLAAIPALHALVRIPCLSSVRIVETIGRNSLMIYLFNTIFIGLAKGLLLLVTGWNGARFLPFAATLMSAGLIGPILLKQRVLRAIPVLDRMTE
jgi:fucose 4-O-acetylase-like acetyltransferase